MKLLLQSNPPFILISEMDETKKDSRTEKIEKLEKIKSLGFTINDTKEGFELQKLQS